MNPLVKTLWRTGNKVSVALYRRTDGRMGGKAIGGVPVLLLTVPGRRTGAPHTNPVGYFEHSGGYIVVGSAGGRKVEPQWFRNLRAAPAAQVRVGSRELHVEVRVLGGAERDEVFRRVVVARAPGFGKYEQKSGRQLPLALLTPARG
ncbi:MAG TPA: nitroreductase/quinone reductase family protein [Amycolatopsis sp.]|nr:nitroreductase/quinone reductase family protein [Amycolatopsis sp.]